MKLNIAQCRSAKKAAAPRGLRRSIRIASSSSSSLQQKHTPDSNEGPEFYELLPLSTFSPRCTGHRVRICKRREARRPRPSEIKAFAPKEQPYEGVIDVKLCRQNSWNLEDVVNNGHLGRQKSFTYDQVPLTRQRSFGNDDKVLARQRSFSTENCSEATLCRQASLKIEALIEPRALSRQNSCTTIGRKRVVGVDDFSQKIEFANVDDLSPLSILEVHEFSPRKKFASPRTHSTCLDRSPSASLTVSQLEFLRQRSLSPPSSPSTSTSNSNFDISSWTTGDSALEDLPFDLLLRIVCCLEHDDLRAVSFVSPRLSRAVSIAQDYYFSYATPRRAKKGKSAQIYLTDDDATTPKVGLAAPFIRPTTPNAPQHCSRRPADLRFEEELFGSCLSQEKDPMAKHATKTFGMGIATQRVLFDEEELCKAVAQNSL